MIFAPLTYKYSSVCTWRSSPKNDWDVLQKFSVWWCWLNLLIVSSLVQHFSRWNESDLHQPALLAMPICFFTSALASVSNSLASRFAFCSGVSSFGSLSLSLPLPSFSLLSLSLSSWSLLSLPFFPFPRFFASFPELSLPSSELDDVDDDDDDFFFLFFFFLLLSVLALDFFAFFFLDLFFLLFFSWYCTEWTDG